MKKILMMLVCLFIYQYTFSQHNVEDFNRWLKQANNGDPQAQYYVGRCYHRGIGIANYDNTKAKEWLEKAAANGNAQAQYTLGLWEEGKNSQKAYQYLLSAANQGNAAAQYALGVSFCRGNYTKEIEWYKKSANQGYATAQYALGFAYEHGEGVPQDYSVAYSWYTKAAVQGHEESLIHCGHFEAKGIGVERQDKLTAYIYYSEAYSSCRSDIGRAVIKSYMKDLRGTNYKDPGIGIEYGYVEEVWGIENNFVSSNGEEGILIHAELFVNALKSK